MLAIIITFIKFYFNKNRSYFLAKNSPTQALKMIYPVMKNFPFCHYVTVIFIKKFILLIKNGN